jgi:translation initiation factor eIF-2B subunit delta
MNRIDEAAAAIGSLRTHSSSEVAVMAARALTELLERDFATVDEYERALERNSEALRRANRSHASLQTTQRAICDRVVGETTDVEAAKAATRAAIDGVIDGIETAKAAAAERARDRLEDGTTFLTHDCSTTVTAAVEAAADDGASLTAYVTEARPRCIGRKTARQFARIDGVETHLVVDSAAGHFLPECDHVLVGMTCIVDDTLYNRVGTFPIAATADEVGVPVTAVGSSTKVVEGGFAFENDFREANEVLREPVDFAVDNPAYDGTPLDLLDAVVTDEGIRRP